MALPTSGPISLLDVQTEFGGAAPISLTEYYAGGGYVAAGTSGTNGAVPTSGTISLWNLLGSMAGTFYARIFGPTTLQTKFTVLPISESWIEWQYSYNNIETSGTKAYVPITVSNYGAGTSVNGIHIFDKMLGTNSSTMYSYSITGYNLIPLIIKKCKTSDNLIVVFSRSYPFNSTYVYNFPSIVCKINQSGTILWSKEISFPGNTSSYGSFLFMEMDSSDNIYFAGMLNWNPGKVVVTKLLADGSGVSWSRVITGAQYYLQPKDLQIDSSGNIYISAFEYPMYGGASPMRLFKYNSSGVLQWQRVITCPSTYMWALAITIDSAGDIYALLVGTASGTSEICHEVHKFSGSTGASVGSPWPRKLINTFSGSSIYHIFAPLSLKVLSNGEIVLSYGSTNSAANGNRNMYYYTPKLCWAKYNSSGVLQLSRAYQEVYLASSVSSQVCCKIDEATGSIFSAVPVSIDYNNTSQYYVSADQALLFMRLPIDGSKTGTKTFTTNSGTFNHTVNYGNVATITDTNTNLLGATSSASTLTEAAVTPSIATITVTGPTANTIASTEVYTL